MAVKKRRVAEVRLLRGGDNLPPTVGAEAEGAEGPQLLTANYSPLATHYLLLTTHRSVISSHSSLPTTYYSLITTHYSLPTADYLLLTT